MSKYNAKNYKAWYERNKTRIRPNKKAAKKKYRRTEAGRAAQRRYNHKESTKLRVRDRNLILRYGITLAEYTKMMEERNGCCDICGKKENKLHVDHDHNTGIVRGLLCGNCNRAIGLLKDRIEVAQKVITYLDVHKNNSSR